MEKKIKQLKNNALAIRKHIIEMVTCAQSGHPGGSLSAADIITCLYFHVMRHDPKNINWPLRDRFHLSKGHCCPAWYAALALSGYFPESELMTLRKLGSRLQGHPDQGVPGVEFSSGSLGQGLSISMGMALAAKLDKQDWRVYCLMGDGELQEGNIWEAAMAAAHYKLDNLCGIVDYNRFQIDGRVQDIMNIEPLVNKWEAFGWHVIECNGHDMKELIGAFDKAKGIKLKPTVIIANTVKGKGVSFMEHTADFHGKAPNLQEHDLACQELNKCQEEK